MKEKSLKEVKDRKKNRDSSVRFAPMNNGEAMRRRYGKHIAFIIVTLFVIVAISAAILGAPVVNSVASIP